MLLRNFLFISIYCNAKVKRDETKLCSPHRLKKIHVHKILEMHKNVNSKKGVLNDLFIF